MWLVVSVRFNGAAGAIALSERGISISEAARLIDVDRSHLSNVLAGRRSAGGELVKKFADLTGMSPMAFVGPDNPREALLALNRIYKVTAAELEAAS